MRKYETIGKIQNAKIKINRFDITGVNAVKLTRRGKLIILGRYEYLMSLFKEHKNEISLNPRGKEIFQTFQEHQRKNKKNVLLKEVLGSPKIGNSVKIRIHNGDIVITSPVERILLGSQIYIETNNTIYYNCDV